LLFLTTIVAVKKGAALWLSGHWTQERNNPQDFFAWGKGSSVSYSFRYDPRAADEWLFHSGAWLLATSRPPATLTNPEARLTRQN